MLAHDQSTNKIHRYDPTTGAYLGAFNHLGYFVISRMIADSTTGTLHALAGNSVYQYNYSTGAYLGVQTIGSSPIDFVFSPDRTKYYGVNSSGVVTSSTIGLTGYTTLSGTFTNAPDAALWHGDKLVTSNLATKTYTMSTITGTTLTQVYSGLHMNAVAASVKNMIVLQGTNGASDRIMQPIGGPNLATPFIFSSGLSGSSTSSYSGFQFANVLSVAAGHQGYFYVTGTTAGGSLHTMMVNEFQYGGLDFTMPQITTFGQMAVAIAPEPGTWAALGLGALALLRRKR